MATRPLNITDLDSPGSCAMRTGPSRRSIWDFETSTTLLMVSSFQKLHPTVTSLQDLFVLNRLGRSLQVKRANLQLPCYRHRRRWIASRSIAGLILQLS